MRIEPGLMVALGYGKFFRSDRIAGLEPIEEGRGPGKRTNVYIDNVAHSIVASRSSGAILRDLAESPEAITRSKEQQQLLGDILDSIEEVNPMLRSIIREQGAWDINRLEERVREVLEGG